MAQQTQRKIIKADRNIDWNGNVVPVKDISFDQWCTKKLENSSNKRSEILTFPVTDLPFIVLDSSICFIIQVRVINAAKSR